MGEQLSSYSSILLYPPFILHFTCRQHIIWMMSQLICELTVKKSMSALNVADIDCEEILSEATETRDQLQICNMSQHILENFPPDLFEFASCRSVFLSPTDKLQIFSLLEYNMKDIYLENWGWNADEKKRELFSPGQYN